MGIGTLGGDDFFQVGLENSLYKKIVNTNLQEKKKPHPQIYIFFVGVNFFFLYVVAKDSKNFKFLGRPSAIEGPHSLFGRGG